MRYRCISDLAIYPQVMTEKIEYTPEIRLKNKTKIRLD